MNKNNLKALALISVGFASLANAGSMEAYHCSWNQKGKSDIKIQLNVVTYETKIQVVNELPVTETSPTLLGTEIHGIATYIKSPAYKRETYILPGRSGDITILKDLSSGEVSLAGLDSYASSRQLCELE